MSASHLDRRNFTRLSLAAFGGALSGTAALAQQAPPIEPPSPIAPPPVEPPKSTGEPAKDPAEADPQAAPDDKNADNKAAADKKINDKKKPPPKEIHICRGLNMCAGQGASGDNKCAGQGTCATTPGAPHECATGNLCKRQGGCGPTAGKNQCNGYGNGQVPIIEEEWWRLRREFEARMKRLGKKIGTAPLSPDEQEWNARYLAAKAKAEAEQAAKEAAEREGRTPPGEAPPRRNDPGPTTPKNEGDTADALEELTGDKEKKKP